jgi:uncharacterized delta-60 repeat protein
METNIDNMTSKTLKQIIPMKNYLITIVLSVALTLHIGLTAQDAGSLDPTFADNGKFIIDNGNLDLFTDVEIQNDGKIIAIGITYDAAYVASAQAIRFMTDGTIDESFATNGVFTYSLNFEANVYGCAIRDNGKIVMTGSTTDYNDYRILLIQLNENGTLDNSFGVGGVVVQKIGPDMNFFEDHSYAITLQDDGMILVAGKSYNLNFQSVPVVVRFTESGMLDTTFGTEGVAGIPVTGVDNDFDCIVLQDDDKIVVSGHYESGLSYFTMLVARFNSNGTLDGTFGNNGIFNTSIGNVDDEGFGVAINADNKIIVTGFTATAGYNYSMLLMQLDNYGILDPSFGSGGIVVADYGQYDVGNSIHLQSNGKILVAGASGALAPDDFDMAVWRYNPDGTIDETFGIDGMSKIQFNGNPDEALAMAHQSDGKIIIAGKARDTNFDYGMARLLNDFSTGIIENETTAFRIAPNPAAQNSNLMISYELSAPDNIRFEVINATGTIVSLIELGYQDAGLQTSSFTLPSSIGQGVYYIRVRGNGYEGEASKLIVTK